MESWQRRRQSVKRAVINEQWRQKKNTKQNKQEEKIFCQSVVSADLTLRPCLVKRSGVMTSKRAKVSGGGD